MVVIYIVRIPHRISKEKRIICVCENIKNSLRTQCGWYIKSLYIKFAQKEKCRIVQDLVKRSAIKNLVLDMAGEWCEQGSDVGISASQSQYAWSSHGASKVVM